MEFFNLLATAEVVGYTKTFDISLDWLGNIIRWLITSVGSVGVGVILFSLILKLVTMPFDVYQRVNMRRQNRKMKDNQAKMEKLQKQYANDQQKYNQKVMEMYKESGISMFSSCLPMIFTMIIFIVAIGAFQAYSQYASVENYNIMVDAYNTKIQELYDGDLSGGAISSDISEDGKTTIYKFNADYLYENNTAIQTYVDAAENAAAEDENATFERHKAVENYIVEQAQSAVVKVYAETIEPTRTSFLWIRNVWETDAVHINPVQYYQEFKTAAESQKFRVGNEDKSLSELGNYTPTYQEDAYNVITGKLTAEKQAANGYYVLIVLSIGTILLQQWISMRSQKEQNKYSSVDGQGASQQKITMIMMTVMFGIFSFSYSSAFSIYMIVSNLFSMLSTFVINFFVDRHENKKEAKALQEKYNKRFPGRVASGAKTDADKKNK